MNNKKAEKCSVIVLNYNGKQFLEGCLQSLLIQTYTDYKIYVLDNASKDGSVQFLKERFPQVAVIEADKNYGTAEGSNVGVRNTQGEYIVLMSNDIKADTHCIEYLVRTIEDDPAIGICSSKLVKYSPDTKTGKYTIDNAGGVIDKFGFPMTLRMDELHDERETTLKEVFFSCGGSFIIRRDLFDKIGGFDYKYFTLSDDIDLSWRVWLAGYKVVVNCSSFIYHKVSATLGVLFPRSEKRFWSERNILRSMLKNYQTHTLLFILPQYFFLLLSEAVFYLFIFRFDLFLALSKAVRANIVNFHDTMSQRSRVNKFRIVSDKVILNKMSKGSIKMQVVLQILKEKGGLTKLLLMQIN